MDEFCIIPVGGVQLYLLLLGQRETVPHRACCREALTAEVFVRHASRRQEAEQVSSMAWVCTVRREKSVVNFWGGQR